MLIPKFQLRYVFFFLWLSIGLAVIACTRSPAVTTNSPTPSPSISQPIPSNTSPAPTLSYEIIHSYPHDRSAFTQGLVFDNGVLYESTGLYGQSSLRRVGLETGRVLQIHNLTAEYFAEGIALYKNQIFQLTWKNHTGFVYDKESFNTAGTFTYPTEGWGLTYDGKRLIMSDGTSTLHFWNPETFQETGSVKITDNGLPVNNLNELEYVKGKIYANVWQTDKIAIINPENGTVEAWLDLTGIINKEAYKGTIDVLNGIAYDTQADRLFVTGKLWPFLYEIEVN